jgi:uncharacterized protein YneF (UPF0154 family)
MNRDLFTAINKPSVNARIKQKKKAGGFGFVSFVCLLCGLVGGYFAGREHLKYEMREAFSNVQSELKKIPDMVPPSIQGMGDRFRKSP